MRSASVLIPTWQGAEFLERVLDRLAAQEPGVPWELFVIDSGSTDGTLAILERRRAGFPVPLRVRGIDPVEFDHGDTRNQLAAWSSGDLLVFLTQDAIPARADWLATLVAAFADPKLGAATCRNVPRPDAAPATVLLCRDDPGYATEGRRVRLPPPDEYAGMDPHERRLLYNFNDVASAIRRELWRRHPFPRTQFGEDVLMARALLEAGYEVAYLADAAVEHSHDFGPEETYRRAAIDGRFNAEWLDRVCIASKADARVLAERLALQDAEAIRRAGQGEAPQLERELAALRDAAFRGLYEGGRAERRRPATRVLDGDRLHVLYVVHGFPPETWAGTEVYTLNLATEMKRRGHRCTVLARSPGRVGGPPDFGVEEGQFEGLRVLRMTHRLEHGRLSESYREPRAEAAFREILARERPDLVHFQHLIHTSAGLVHVAAEAGLPTVVHCHDFWPLCARVQFIRPDGVRCEENMGLGCVFCVKEKDVAHVPRWKKVGEAVGPALDLAARTAQTGAFGRRLAESAGAYLDMCRRGPFVLGAWAAADLVVSPSRFLREKLLASGAFDPETFLYSDNGMRTDHVAALAKCPDATGRVRFGFVGSLVWYKGVDVLLRAVRRLEGKPIVLSVFGDFRPEADPHHAALAGLAAQNVHFRGRFDNAKLSRVYAEIDVLVVPSIWFENSPITIHEAFLTRTPVVASDIGGMAEYVRDGLDGLLFRAGDDEALARTLARFVDEPGLLAELGREFPTIKTIDEDAALTEARYRALLARVPLAIEGGRSRGEDA